MFVDCVAWAAVLFSLGVLVELIRLDLLFFRGLKTEPRLGGPLDQKVAGSLPLLSVIVAAKDEERYIAESASSILASDYPDLELVLVNDRSEDRTLELMNKLSPKDSRIKTLSISELPKGWTGKTHAMFQGVNASSGQILVFTDADTVMQADAISRALAFFFANELDMLSLLPAFTERGFAEDVAYTHMAIGIQLFYPLTDVNNRDKPASLASGCFIMLKREVYEEIGTWNQLRHEVTEDVALSKAVKGKGRKLMALRGGSLVRTRPFRTVREACRFWKRTYYGALDKGWLKILRLAASYLALSFNFVLFAGAVLALATGKAFGPAIIVCFLGALATAAILIPVCVIMRQEGGSMLNAFASPLGIFMTAGVALSTLYTVLSDSGILWRGSIYR